MSVGERLSSAREAKGLSLEQLAEKTYIRKQYLEAIERGNFSEVPSSRIRYFVADYARAVGEDPDEVLAELPKDIETEKATKSDVEPLTSGETSGNSESTSWSDKKSPLKPVDMGNPALMRGVLTGLLLVAAVAGVYWLMGGFDSDDEEKRVVQSVADSAGITDSVLAEAEDSAAAAEDAAANDSITLEGRAIGKVWYSVTMDGKRQDTETLDSGEVKTWRATEEFSVTLGNAGGLELLINGRSLGTLGPRGTTVRNQVITSAGLEDEEGVTP